MQASPGSGGYLRSPFEIYPGEVTKRLIEVDDDKLEAVRRLLDTRTLRATVDGALDEVLALAKRRQALLEERGVGDAALADSKARRAAWR